MPADEKADRDLSVRHVVLGASAIIAMVLLSLLMAWALVASLGGTLREPALPVPAFPQPALQSHPLADRRNYEAQERQKSTPGTPAP